MCHTVHNEQIVHNFDGLAGLQNCMDILKSEPGSFIGTCQMSSDDGDRVVGIRGEGVTDIKVEEDPGPAKSTVIKAEHAVSCMFVCTGLCALDQLYMN